MGNAGVLLSLLALTPPFCALLPDAAAQEPPPVIPPGLEKAAPSAGVDAESILRKYRETHASPFEEGLRSFQVEASFLNLSPNRRPLRVLLAWKGPGKETLEVISPSGKAGGRRRGRKNQPKVDSGPRKDWRTNFLKGVGDVLAGASLKAFLSRGEVKTAPPGGGGDALVIKVFKGKRLMGTAWFDPATGLLERIADDWRETRFTYARLGKRWVPASFLGRRKTRGKPPKKGKKGKPRPVVFQFSAYRKINGFFLPTRMTTRDSLGPVEIGLQYILVNGKPALADAADPKVTLKKIKEFESGWRKWSPEEKIQAIRDLEEAGGPKVALALAKKLRDPSLEVRRALVQALGDLRERAAVPFLIWALDGARKNPAFFARVCRALGEIGDPRAVKALAKKILSGNTKTPEWRALAQARINALSRIEAPEAVDELIKLLSMAGGGGRRATRGRGRGPLYKYVQAALRKLTGQEFKFAYQWHKWWKAHRARFFRKKK